MPGFHIHVAIGSEHKKKYRILNAVEFDKGIVSPDLVKDKSVSHYTGYQDKNDLFQYLENKVNLYEFLKQNDISDDYKKGEFLHLATDYLFFNYFMDKEYLKRVDYNSFCKDLYYSYDITNDYLFQKYKIDFPVFKQEILKAISDSHIEKNVDDGAYLNILPIDKLDYFITMMGNMNLERYASKIKKLGKNCLPQELMKGK